MTMAAPQPTRRGPLAGVRVLELAGVGPGPFCAMMLADQGATVLRIDRPGTGSDRPEREILNRGRRSAVLDLKNPLAVDALLRLVDTADVLLEGLRPWRDERGVNLLDGGVPWYDVYETADGRWMAVGALEPQFYASLLAVLDLPDAPDRGDPASWPALRSLFTARFKERSRDEWVA